MVASAARMPRSLSKLIPAEPAALALTLTGIGPTQKRLSAEKNDTSQLFGEVQLDPDPDEVPVERLW